MRKGRCSGGSIAPARPARHQQPSATTQATRPRRRRRPATPFLPSNLLPNPSRSPLSPVRALRRRDLSPTCPPEPPLPLLRPSPHPPRSSSPWMVVAPSARPSSTRPVLSTRAASLALLVLLASGALPSTEAFQLSAAAPKTVDALVSQYGLSQAFTFPQPSGALASSRAGTYLKDNWSLNRQQVRVPASRGSWQSGTDRLTVLCLPMALSVRPARPPPSLRRSKPAPSTSRSRPTRSTRRARTPSSRSTMRKAALAETARVAPSSMCASSPFATQGRVSCESTPLTGLFRAPSGPVRHPLFVPSSIRRLRIRSAPSIFLRSPGPTAQRLLSAALVDAPLVRRRLHSRLRLLPGRQAAWPPRRSGPARLLGRPRG